LRTGALCGPLLCEELNAAVGKSAARRDDREDARDRRGPVLAVKKERCSCHPEGIVAVTAVRRRKVLVRLIEERVAKLSDAQKGHARLHADDDEDKGHARRQRDVYPPTKPCEREHQGHEEIDGKPNYRDGSSNCGANQERAEQSAAGGQGGIRATRVKHHIHAVVLRHDNHIRGDGRRRCGRRWWSWDGARRW